MSITGDNYPKPRKAFLSPITTISTITNYQLKNHSCKTTSNPDRQSSDTYRGNREAVAASAEKLMEEKAQESFLSHSLSLAAADCRRARGRRGRGGEERGEVRERERWHAHTERKESLADWLAGWLGGRGGGGEVARSIQPRALATPRAT